MDGSKHALRSNDTKLFVDQPQVFRSDDGGDLAYRAPDFVRERHIEQRRDAGGRKAQIESRYIDKLGKVNKLYRRLGDSLDHTLHNSATTI